MSDVAIKVEGLGKKYLIGHNAAGAERNTTFREAMSKGVKDLVRKSRDMVRGEQIVQGDSVEEFWALKDVSFEIKKGDTVGIIGRNGAGKSTLLKILSRITEPTNGRISINGRVASLLEVGTGFHPELTGRENIYLNGAILGMNRAEIQRKFDEIVEFSEVEKFLDTPVKRYSSGMYVRLAFAVAAHLEPEILIVDEVLAVGDAEFQKKCMGRMGGLATEGRTILFVSHNLGAIKTLCNSAVLLSDGRIKAIGSVVDVTESYLNKSREIIEHSRVWEMSNAPGVENVKLLAIQVQDSYGHARDIFDDAEEIQVHIRLHSEVNISDFALVNRLHAIDGGVVLKVSSNVVNQALGLKQGINDYLYKIPPHFLKFGQYSLSVAGHSPFKTVYFSVEETISFAIQSLQNEIIRYPAPEWTGFFAPSAGNWLRK